MIHTLRKITLFAASLVVAAAVLILVIGQVRGTQEVDAGANHNFAGFAWSDMPTTSNEVSNPTGGTVGRGAGWISFNSLDTGSSVDYGVNVDAAGTITGTAWSEHVGWISFNTVSGCPAGTCQPRIENGSFRGWARALSYTDPQAGGWDGWISFSSTNHGGSVPYGWTVNASGVVSGYAWGGDVLGWIAPQGLQINQNLPIANLVLTANPVTITHIPNTSDRITTLTYNSPGTPSGTTTSLFSSCSLATSPTSGSTTEGTAMNGRTMPQNYPLPLNGNYTINNVRVFAPQTVYTLTCTPVAGGSTVTATATVTIVDPQPSVALSGPSCVQNAGTSAQLVWAGNNVTSCTINNGVGAVPNVSGNQAVTVNATTTYTITCAGSFGSANASHTISVNPSCQQSGDPSGLPIFNEV